MEANEERGEVEITLGGTVYVMRPSYQAMISIERLTGRTMVALAVSVGEGRFGSLTLDECAHIVTQGIHAAGRDRGDKVVQAYKTEKIGEMIYDDGIVESLPVIENFLINALSGGTKKKAKKSEEESPPGE